MGNKAYLVLENGKVFSGESFGAAGEVMAEVVFTTGMTGYLETLTDKSYFGQIVVQTFPLIGNYGVIPSDFEGDMIGPRGYIVKEWCQSPSNFRSEGDLDTFFKERGVIGLCGIDTRSLTKIIRESGVMNGVITADPEHVDFEKLRAYRVTDAVESTSVKEIKRCENPNKKVTVALMDYGMKENIRRKLEKFGAEVIICPYDTTAEQIKALHVDGIMLSNGPGDPADNPEVIRNLQAMMQLGIPIFGICLGHQLLALANGADTEKLKYGHRGANQPVKDLLTGRDYITSQNHGYAVKNDSLPDNAVLRFINLNDGTCEGVSYQDFPGFSVQFHPEACGGPHDSEFLFREFVALMERRA